MKTDIKNIAIPFLGSKKLKVFLLFLLLTGVTWFLMEMSKTYTSTVNYTVNYTNLPATKILAKPPQENITAFVTATGFLLWKQQVKVKEIKVNLSKLNYNNGKTYVLPNNQLKKLNSEKKGTLKIEKFATDTIFIDLLNKASKKVPIIPQLHLNYKVGYNLMGNLKVTPDSVKIQGPEKIINTITEVKTVEKTLNNISEDIKTSLKLINKHKKNNVTYSFYMVNIKGKVEKFTESTLNIPIQLINVTETSKVSIFPKEVTLTCTVNVSKFSTLKKQDFKVVVDYNQFKKDSLLTYLTPKVITKPKGVKFVKIIPQKVNFLIQK